MHTFKLVTQTLHASLTEESYNKCLDYEQEMWPELQSKLDDFEERAKKGAQGGDEKVFELADLDEDKFDINNFGKPPAIPEPIEIIVPIVTDFTEG